MPPASEFLRGEEGELLPGAAGWHRCHSYVTCPCAAPVCGEFLPPEGIDLLGWKVLAGCSVSASLSPAFLFKTLKALLVLLFNQRIHDDMGSSSFHCWDPVCTASAIESCQGRAY